VRAGAAAATAAAAALSINSSSSLNSTIVPLVHAAAVPPTTVPLETLDTEAICLALERDSAPAIMSAPPCDNDHAGEREGGGGGRGSDCVGGGGGDAAAQQDKAAYMSMYAKALGDAIRRDRLSAYPSTAQHYPYHSCSQPHAAYCY
jgi:hypothetical protein